MLYLNKFLSKVKENPAIFKTPEIILVLGLTSSQIKDLKKYALENQLITQSKQWYFLTEQGERYLSKNKIQEFENKQFPLRPRVNVEYLKEEKLPSVLTKAIRLLAKHLIEKEPLKEFSLEHAIYEDTKNWKILLLKFEEEILNGKRVVLEDIYKKYLDAGLTKSIISICLLIVLAQNTERIAIYEKFQFQLKFNQLMFDRMMACPHNFEIQKTEMPDEYLLKDVSKIILNKKSDNILEITKGLYTVIKSLDKYTLNTQNLTPKTLRLRTVILNAKDPISLFEKDIPKALSKNCLQDCDRDFLNNLKIAMAELKECTDKLVDSLKEFLFEAFCSKSKEELSERFLAIKDFINEKELKVLLNSVVETNVSDDLWIKRIATFINKSRVPKDWSDEDYADFKIKTKELALKFFVLEATVGTSEKSVTKNYYSVLNKFLKLTKQEQLILLRNVVNN